MRSKRDNRKVARLTPFKIINTFTVKERERPRYDMMECSMIRKGDEAGRKGGRRETEWSRRGGGGEGGWGKMGKEKTREEGKRWKEWINERIIER